MSTIGELLITDRRATDSTHVQPPHITMATKIYQVGEGGGLLDFPQKFNRADQIDKNFSSDFCRILSKSN